MKNIKKVQEVVVGTPTDRIIKVDYDTKKLIHYDNDVKVITYNAKVHNDNSWSINFQERGIVDNIEDRLKQWNNPVKFDYAKKIGYDSDNKDPEKKLWSAYVDIVKANPSFFFTKSGNWKKRISINKSDLNDLELSEVDNLSLTDKVKAVLDSDVSAYALEHNKDENIRVSHVITTKLRNGTKKISELSLATAEKYGSYYDQYIDR